MTHEAMRESPQGRKPDTRRRCRCGNGWSAEKEEGARTLACRARHLPHPSVSQQQLELPADDKLVLFAGQDAVARHVARRAVGQEDDVELHLGAVAVAAVRSEVPV